MKKGLLLIISVMYAWLGHSQGVDLYLKATLKVNQDKLYRNLVQYTINHNLSQPLSDSTEENWQDAFQAMEVLQYNKPWIERQMHTASESLISRTVFFQRSFLELLYSHYPGKFIQPVQQLLKQTSDAKIFAMCAVYLLKSDTVKQYTNFLTIQTKLKLQEQPNNPILLQLQRYITTFYQPLRPLDISSFFNKNYLPGNVLLISFQRKNRDYPGLVMVRDASGNFVKDSTGNYFSVPQLARSVSGLPPFLTNGNSPEGIFRMDKFDVSVSTFIGPTPNLQLSMPFEKKAFHFFQTQNENDTTWNIERYKNLLPDNFKNYDPMYQAWYAGMAGRTEIIAHGSTVNPGYYKGQPFYPLTPTQGCLATKEIWSTETGKRTESDQQKLVYAILKAGGANGYAVVININNDERPVTISEIIPFLKNVSAK
ncbi:MAG: hypothetical protein ABIY51_02995 [Ferruginibacter sp.]